MRRILGSRLFDGRLPVERFDAGRVCAVSECGVVLSRYNSGLVCNVHKVVTVR